MSSPQKETKAQRAERLKQEKNPWECLEEIRQFARSGYDSISPEWRGTYLRRGGIFPQGGGGGGRRGRGGGRARRKRGGRLIGSVLHGAHSASKRTSILPSTAHDR